MIKLKQLLTEKTVRLSTMKDANFEPGQFVQLMGKKGMVKLDKKSVNKLAKIVRQLSGKKGMGWSFTMEGKLSESSPYKTASRNELAMYISQLSTTIKNTKDRKMLNYLKKDKKEVEKELKSRKTNEGKLTEGISVADERHVGKFLIVILSSGSEMRSAILSKKNADKYNRNDKNVLKTLWNLAGKYKGKEIKEGKLNEGSKVVTLPNGIKVKIDFKGLTFIGGTKPVFLDRTEMEKFFKATARYLK